MTDDLDPVRRFRDDVPEPDSASWAIGRAALGRAVDASREPAVSARGWRGARLRASAGRHTRLTAGFAVLTLAVTSAGFADATGLLGLGQPVSPSHGSRAPLALAPDPTDLKTLGIFRRPPRAGDALAATNRASDPVGTSTGLNLRLARKVSFGWIGAAWVIPADGGVCLTVKGYIDRRQVFGGGSCNDDSHGHPPYLESLSFGERAPGIYLLAGLVPDGVRIVDIRLDDGTRESLRVTDNVYMADIRSPVHSTAFSIGGRTVKFGTLKAP
jgi:hypothetical protein